MDVMQDALELAGFTLNPKVGRFQAVLAVIRVGPSAWRFGYSPSRLMWRVAPDVARTHADLSSSACNKLDEALMTCGFKQGVIDVWCSIICSQCLLLVVVLESRPDHIGFFHCPLHGACMSACPAMHA
jgi:hypothetical protein